MTNLRSDYTDMEPPKKENFKKEIDKKEQMILSAINKNIMYGNFMQRPLLLSKRNVGFDEYIELL